MSRLTKRHGKYAVQIGGETRRHDEVWLKLADYEDIEEQGRLIEQKNGAWNENTFAFCSICSECGVIVDSYAIKRQSGKLNYCPNCGVKMELMELEGVK